VKKSVCQRVVKPYYASMAKHCGKFFQKKRKKSKEWKLGKSKTRKSGLGNRERPGGLKTRNGDVLFSMRPSPRNFAECVVLQMSLRLPSYMFCLVSSSLPVICNCPQFIQSCKSHSFIHSYNYIHTLILSHINAYTTYKQYQSIHGCISH